MPLQGLQGDTKENLLRDLVNKKISFKELQERSKSIKQKRKVVELFMKYTGASSWEELTARFPRQATEEKIAQFTKVPIRGNCIPLVGRHLLKCFSNPVYQLHP